MRKQAVATASAQKGLGTVFEIEELSPPQEDDDSFVPLPRFELVCQHRMIHEEYHVEAYKTELFETDILLHCHYVRFGSRR